MSLFFFFFFFGVEILRIWILGFFCSWNCDGFQALIKIFWSSDFFLVLIYFFWVGVNPADCGCVLCCVDLKEFTILGNGNDVWSLNSYWVLHVCHFCLVGFWFLCGSWLEWFLENVFWEFLFFFFLKSIVIISIWFCEFLFLNVIFIDNAWICVFL